MNRYYDATLQRNALKILPGEYAFGEGGDVIVTVLGSCVSACIRDKRQRIGGMNHFMLPLAHFPSLDRAAHYGVHAMELVVNHLMKRGSRRQDLTAKVFGGAAVFGHATGIGVGRDNGEFVQRFLQFEGIPILAEDLFKETPRKVYFFPDTGEVRVKYLRTLKNDTVVKRERAYVSSFLDIPESSVDLF